MEGATMVPTVQLVLPPLTLPLPSYLDPYMEADETALMALKEAMQKLIKVAWYNAFFSNLYISGSFIYFNVHHLIIFYCIAF